MRRFFDPWWVTSGTVLAVVLSANVSRGQVPGVPSVPDVVPGTIDTAQETVQDATNAAQDAVDTAQDNAKDLQQDAANAAQDATKSTQDTVKEAQQGATAAAQDAAKNAQSVQQDAASAASDALKNANNAQRDAASAATDAAKRAQNAQRDAAGAAQDAAKGVQDIQEDATRVTRDATKAARDATRNVRDAADDISKDVGDVTRDVRDTARDARDTARDVRDSARDAIDGRTNQALNNYRAADLGLWFDRSVRDGLIIADVAADTAFGRIGFREGDRIVSVAGQNITTETDFIRYLRSNNRGRVPVIVLRDGQRETLYVEPTVFTRQSMTVAVDPLEQFGIILDDRYDDRLLVWRVIPRSAAFYAGIRAGDVITTFGSQRLGDHRAFVQVLQTTKPGLIPIQVNRNGAMRTIQADFDGLQTVDRHTTLRQDLDAGVNVDARTPAGRISADANADLNANPLPATRAAADVVPVPDRRPTYSNSGSNYSQPRGVFRRRR